MGIASVLDPKIIPPGATILPRPVNPSLSNIYLASTDFVGDYGALPRSLVDLVESVAAVKAFPGSGPILDVLTGKDAGIVYQLSGTTAILNTVKGVHEFGRTLHQLDFSTAIGDKQGVLLGRVGLGLEVTRATAGTVFEGYRGLNIAATIKGVSHSGFNAPTMLGRATYGFLFVGLILWAVFFSIYCVIFGIRSAEASRLKKQIDAEPDLAKKIEILQKKFSVDPQELYAKLLKKEGSKEAADKALLNEGWEIAKESLRSYAKSLNLTLSEDKLKEAVEQVVFKQQPMETKTLEEMLCGIGLEGRVTKARIKNEIKLERTLGSTVAQELKKELIGRTTPLTDPKSVEIIDKLKGAIASQQKEFFKVAAIFLLGAIAMVAGMVLVSGPGAIVAAALLVSFNIIAMIVLDIPDMMAAYRYEKPAPYDKKALAASSLLAVASATVLVALAASGVVTFGIVPMITAFVLTGLWLGHNGVSLYILERNQAHFASLKPPPAPATLATLLNTINNGATKEEIQKILQQVPEQVRTELLKKKFYDRVVSHIPISALDRTDVRVKENAKKLIQLMEEKQRQLHEKLKTYCVL